MSNPFFERQKKERAIGGIGRKSEENVARRLGARLQPNSGAMLGVKGDMTLEDWLLEAKSTEANSMSLSLDWLAKISREAQSATKYPALTVTFVDAQGRPVPKGAWVMIPEYMFRELVEGSE